MDSFSVIYSVLPFFKSDTGSIIALFPTNTILSCLHIVLSSTTGIYFRTRFVRDDSDDEDDRQVSKFLYACRYSELITTYIIGLIQVVK